MLKKIKNNKVKRLENANTEVLTMMEGIYESLLEYERMATKYRDNGQKSLYYNVMNIIKLKEEHLDKLRERHSEIFDKIEKIRN